MPNKKMLQLFKLINTLTLKFLILLIASNDLIAKEFIVGVEDLQYEPYFYHTPRGNYAGYSRDLLDAFAKYSNHKITYKKLSIPDLFEAFFYDEIDFKYPDNPKWNSDAKTLYDVSYSNSAVRFIDGIITLEKNKDLNIDSLKTLSIIKGFSAPSYLKNTKLIETNSLASSIDSILIGKTQALYGNIIVANYKISKISKSKVVLNKNFTTFTDHYHLSTINYPEVIEEFNNFLIEQNELVISLRKKI